ncbi:hypothetical protein [Pantoea ananatis]|uniref:hypothetical protein n=1 Tax=Pantoea ananas TaxID=553 RepID=UPI000F85EB5B|nr:hypothetical protein [Pantoea ananatis]RQN05205.1 hypothetical protein EHQ51_10155 [Pantoea ananatis]
MSKKALTLSAIVLATTLTGCSSFMSGIGQSGLLNDGQPVMAFKKSAVQSQPAVVSGTNRPPAHCGGFESSLARNSLMA